MKKIIIRILAVLGAFFLIYLLTFFLSGFFSTFTPTEAVQKGKCMAECQEKTLSDDCIQYCNAKQLNK